MLGEVDNFPMQLISGETKIQTLKQMLSATVLSLRSQKIELAASGERRMYRQTL